jgi:hypothetical protein
MSSKHSEIGIAAAVVFGALLLAIMSPLWWQDNDHAWPVVKKTGNFWEDVAIPRERAVRTIHSRILRRDELKLTVSLADGGTRTYLDDESAHYLRCGNDGEPTEECIAYHVWEISPDLRYVTLRIGYYEDGSALLLDRATNAELYLADVPFLSPDGAHWAMVDADDADEPGNVSIIAPSSGAPRIIATGTVGVCDFGRWDTDTSFLITCYDLDLKTETELRVTWDSAGNLAMTPTGRTTSGEL